MITVRQLERLWEAKSFARMSSLLLDMRPESSLRLTSEFSRATPAAALAVIRLDELSQAHTPFCARMIRHLLASQEADGGWADAATTALAIRALSCCDGHGLAIDHAVNFLANLQKEDGSWPKIPLRRLPGDAFTTATVLFYLTDNARFAQLSAPQKAMTWLSAHDCDLDEQTLKLCRTLRLRHTSTAREEPSLSWS
jgi:hypothetical protein